MIYARRNIKVSFSGTTMSGGSVNQSFENLRMSARILKAGGVNISTAETTIYGLSLDHIIQLSTLGTRWRPNYNIQITIEAGDAVNGMSVVHHGGIKQAWADMQNMPDVPFHIISAGGLDGETKTIKPTSYSGSADVPTMLQGIAGQAGYQFENSGVQAKLDNPYHWGSPWKQITEIIEAANIGGIVDDGILSIWPQGGYRQGDDLFISPQTGMRAYPAFTEYGVLVVVEFTRAVKYGAKMTVQSDIKPACGPWQIINIDYDLQSQTPRGNWFARISGTQLGAPVTMIGK